jgi:hypothetical protein
MEEKELRIGNYVIKQDDYPKKTIQITYDCFDKMEANRLQRCFEHVPFVFEPIQLTEDWLTKTNLVKSGILYSKGKFAIKPWQVGQDIEWVIFWGDKVILYKKDYKVHQLQNLYFELAGEELEIKKDYEAN